MLNRQIRRAERADEIVCKSISQARKKEGFAMRSVAFKALAVGLVGLAILMLAAPWWSETAWAQQQPIALDVARGDQEITVFGAQGPTLRVDTRNPDEPLGDGLGKVAKGDFNGDGILDLAIGVPKVNQARGAVYLIFGRASSADFPTCRDQAFRRCFDAAEVVGPPPDVVIAGTESFSLFGETVGSGDINGDGFMDILVGEATRDRMGRVHAIFGRANFPRRINIAQETQKLTINGANSDDWLVAVARQSRDVNGDGIDDLIAAAATASPGGRQNAGAVYIFFGSRGLSPRTISAAGANVTIQGRDPGDFIGSADSTAGVFFANSLTSGDLDGDGIADVAIGASGGDGPGNSRENGGEAYVLFGRRDWPGQIDLARQDPDVTIYGAEAGDTLSAEYGVYTANLNGDAVAGRPVLDLLLTAPHGNGPDEDANGQPNDRSMVAGEAYVILGRGRASWPRVIDLCQNVAAPSMNCTPTQQRVPNSGHSDINVFGADVGDLLGKVIAGGDTDGDGVDDLIVSARWSDGWQDFRPNTGEAFVIRGNRDLQSAPSLEAIIAVDTCIRRDILPEGWNCQRQRVPNSRLPNVVLYAAEVGVNPNPDPIRGDGAYFVEIADLTRDGRGEMVMTTNWADGPRNGRTDGGELYAFLGRPLPGGGQQPPPPQEQATLTILASTPQAQALNVQMDFYINPPAGSWRAITTPYQANWPVGTIFRVVAPATHTQNGQQFQFVGWDPARDPWNEDFGANGTTLEGRIRPSLPTFTAIYQVLQERQQLEYLVQVLYTTWENNIMADPPMARVRVLSGSPNGLTGQELELAWIQHPQQAQGRCFLIWVRTEPFMGRQIQNIQRYQEVACQGGTGAVVAQVTIQPGGCGAAYSVGQRVTVTVQIISLGGQSQALFRLLDVLPNGTTQVLFTQVLAVGPYQFQGTITPPTGTETLILQTFLNGQWQEVARCSFQVVGGAWYGNGASVTHHPRPDPSR